MSVTLFTMVYNDCYELLRQFIESVQHNIDPDSYSKIMIIDDYSELNTKLREYEEWLKKDKKFQVINFPEYRSMSIYTNLPNPNMGHGKTFNMAVSNTTTEYLLYMDVDTFFLKKSFNLINNIVEVMNKDKNIFAAGQLFGTTKKEVVSEKYEIFHEVVGQRRMFGGFLGPSSGMCRIPPFNSGEISPFQKGKLPHLFKPYCDEIFDKGYKIYSYPWFTNMEVIHLGRGVVRKHSDTMNGEKDTDWFVFCKDFVKKHATRQEPNVLKTPHYYGRGFVNLTSREYRNYLKDKYNAPFGNIQPALDEGLIYIIDK